VDDNWRIRHYWFWLDYLEKRTKMNKIACIGEAMIELSMDGNTAQVGVAGDTLNTAIYLRRGAPDLQVDYVTCLGDDAFSLQIKEFIETHGVGTSKIELIDGASPGLYAISTTAEGERSFSYWRSDSAARRMFQGKDTCNFDMLSEYDAIYVSGITMAILPHSVRLAFVEWLAKTDIKFIYDSNYRPRLWDSVENARAVTKAMWARADIALPSIDDEMELFDEDAAQVAKRFEGHHGIGALKQGDSGPLSIGEEVSQTYAAALNVVDTTAAGDSFNGGYLAAYLTDGSQAKALRAGHDCAAKVVQFRGAITPK
jgi:2-dehydro-3-deoxygluconokinase